MIFFTCFTCFLKFPTTGAFISLCVISVERQQKNLKKEGHFWNTLKSMKLKILHLLVRNVTRNSWPNIIFDHLNEFIIRKNRPLGEFGEQVVEASHQKLKQIWEWYIVKDLESESHGENLLKCINHFNSFNV